MLTRVQGRRGRQSASADTLLTMWIYITILTILQILGEDNICAVAIPMQQECNSTHSFAILFSIKVLIQCIL